MIDARDRARFLTQLVMAEALARRGEGPLALRKPPRALVRRARAAHPLREPDQSAPEDPEAR